MRKTLRSLLTAGAVGLALAGCGEKSYPQIFKQGVIQSKSFYDGARFPTQDRYTTVIRLLPKSQENTVPLKIALTVANLDMFYGVTSNFGEEARVLDLLYNVGDTVSIKGRLGKTYEIINPFSRTLSNTK